MIHRIHQSPNDIMAENSDKTLSAIQHSIEVGEKNNRKLEEIKSASLITNNHLRKIVKKEVQKMDITNLDNLSVLVGKQGERGTDGRNPLTASKTPPINPQIGDLWYQI